jgi:hypothetical protein
MKTILIFVDEAISVTLRFHRKKDKQDIKTV